MKHKEDEAIILLYTHLTTARSSTEKRLIITHIQSHLTMSPKQKKSVQHSNTIVPQQHKTWTVLSEEIGAHTQTQNMHKNK